MRPVAVSALFALSLHAATSRADGRGLLDLGARGGYALPVGAYDAGTRAGDMSFGTIPFALDAVVRLGPPARWTVGVGGFASLAPSVPRLCASASTCVGSVGRDFELTAMLRVRGPRVAFVLPEGELGAGWSWASRSLEDGDARSTRRWSGPVLLRGALVPTFALGARTRLGIVLGGSLMSTAASRLEAPGVDEPGLPGRLHGTLDLGVRIGIDLFEPSSHESGARNATFENIP
jgi:hypothetical protein